MLLPPKRFPLHRALLVLAIIALTGCTGRSPESLAFTRHYDHPGATLDIASTVEIINQYRISQGKNPLTFNPDLAIIAAQSAGTLSQNASLKTGQRKSGSLNKRLTSAGIAHQSAHEIIAGGYVTFARTFSSWRSVPSQSKILLDDSLTSFAIATHYSGQTSLGIYWVFIGISAPKTQTPTIQASK